MQKKLYKAMITQLILNWGWVKFRLFILPTWVSNRIVHIFSWTKCGIILRMVSVVLSSSRWQFRVSQCIRCHLFRLSVELESIEFKMIVYMCKEYLYNLISFFTNKYSHSFIFKVPFHMLAPVKIFHLGTHL